jgi:tRNA nucleotidyltransferase (CCA-adding enzyme)
MFFPQKKKPLKLAELKKLQNGRETELIAVKFKPPAVVPDILWPQLRRFADRLESILKENEFTVLRKAVYTNEKDLAIVLLEMENCKLPVVRKRIGPSVFDIGGSQNFIKKYKPQAINGPFIESAFWIVETKRKFRTAEEKLEDSLDDPLKILEAKGIPSYVAKQVSKKFELVSDVKRIAALAKKDKEFGVFLRDYFEKESLA